MSGTPGKCPRCLYWDQHGRLPRVERELAKARRELAKAKKRLADTGVHK